jgi:hypothetical protein
MVVGGGREILLMLLMYLTYVLNAVAYDIYCDSYLGGSICISSGYLVFVRLFLTFFQSLQSEIA